MWWTAPLYLVFLAAGLYVENFAMTPAIGLLLAVLVAFGGLDALVLARIAAIRERSIVTADDLAATQRQIERLSRTLVLGGGVLGGIFLIGVLALVLL